MPTKPIHELEAMVGQSHRTVEGLEVEAGKVSEFARAIGDDAGCSQYPAADSGEPALAPLTFTRTAYFPRYRPSGVDAIRPFALGFQREHRVHGEQEYEFKRPVRVGDVLCGEATLTDIYQREGERGGTMTFAEFEIEYRDADDEPVLTERQTIIETGGAGE